MFSYPVLLWFLPFLGLVVLIHLINMFRHRRVEWAALEFLLAGYRKSRIRIFLQQFFLMFLRLLVMAVVILMFAGLKLDGIFFYWLGGRATHHIILLDDSFSMNERHSAQGGVSLFGDAVSVVGRIIDGVSRRISEDRFTLIRLSRAAAVVRGEEPDLAELHFHSEDLRVIRGFLEELNPSQFADHPEQLLLAAVTLIRRSNTRLKPVVYFLSDFRRQHWDEPTSILKSLSDIRQLGGRVRMIRMTDKESANLSIDHLELVDGVHAADVDILLDVTVTNHGQEDVENIPLMLLVDGQSQLVVTIPRIAAGSRTESPVRFPVRLPNSEPHRIEVQLQPDAIPDDNQRFLVLHVPEALEVLLIGTDKRVPSLDSSVQYVRVALSPGGAKSGIRVRVESPSFLSTKPLAPFHAIFLLDIPVLELSAVRALEEYVALGGGLVLFPGVGTNFDFLRNDLYKNGTGLFPVFPVAEAELTPDFLSKTPDITVVAHPIFRLFGEGESPLLGSVKVERYIVVELPERLELSGETTPKTFPRVLATLRNQSPLVLEKEFGKGRTITFLTTAAPIWNNWGRGNPGFVVVMLELAAWLSQRSSGMTSIFVGEPFSFNFDPTLFEGQVRVQMLSDVESGADFSVEAVLLSGEEALATFSRTDQSGFYEMILKEFSGAEVRHFFAVNVHAQEGATILADVSELSFLLRSVDQSLESAAGFSSVATDFSGEQSLSDFLFYTVVLMLMLEAFFAGWILPPNRVPKAE
ncbi:MAG: BatA domain-containing protein [Planctomycetaceae bacterium]|jgi:hypothetical protein|nr:BatA domain-containing protein [Planctomycetaceae bacterium]